MGEAMVRMSKMAPQVEGIADWQRENELVLLDLQRRVGETEAQVGVLQQNASGWDGIGNQNDMLEGDIGELRGEVQALAIALDSVSPSPLPFAGIPATKSDAAKEPLSQQQRQGMPPAAGGGNLPPEVKGGAETSHPGQTGGGGRILSLSCNRSHKPSLFVP